MNIFNEVTANITGRIARFVADNAQLVRAGEPRPLTAPGERAAADSEPHR